MSDYKPYFTVDIGVNFAGKRYAGRDLKGLVQDSYDSGVGAVISISNSTFEIPRNRKLSQDIPQLYYTAGCHPHNAKQFNRKSTDIIREALADPKCVAVGECGLDYDRMFSTREEQFSAFNQQIDIAKNAAKPLYLHCRSDRGDAKQSAYTDFVDIINRQGYFTGVVHCFTGNAQQAQELVKLGFYIGITGWIFDNRRNADLLGAVRHIPAERLLVETDAPFMPIDRKYNESVPMDTGAIVAKLASIKRMKDHELGDIIYDSSRKLFNLPEL